MIAATWLAAAIFCEVTATLSLRGAITNGWLYIVVVAGYIAAFVCLDKTLRLGVPVGVAYGIWGAIGVALSAGLAALIFHEPLTPLMMLGISIIIVGVLCIEFGRKSQK